MRWLKVLRKILLLFVLCIVSIIWLFTKLIVYLYSILLGFVSMLIVIVLIMIIVFNQGNGLVIIIGLAVCEYLFMVVAVFIQEILAEIVKEIWNVIHS